MGWVLIGREVGTITASEVDVGRVVDSEFWGSAEMDVKGDVRGTDTMVMGEWVGKGENPGGISGMEPELAGDVWVTSGLIATQGGERLGLRLK